MLGDLSPMLVPVISIVLIAFIILLSIYREIENRRILNQFITIITHKIKAPLTGIRWTIDMLQKDTSLLEKKDLLEEMQKTNDRLMEVMDLMVGFARFDKKMDYNFETLSLKDIIITSLNKNSPIVKNKNIKFTIESAGELPFVLIDKSKMQFAVDMLVDNAVKYTPKDGSIIVSFEVKDKQITLKIKDSGIGLSFIDSKKIFSHFYRANNAKAVDSLGLGLGLYTARKIVEHHKGKLWGESEGVNKGSTFFIQLPINR